MRKNFKLNFDICSFCNHKCTFCSNDDDRTIKSKINYKDFLTIMKNIIKYSNIDSLSLSAKGEVLLNKDLEKIIISSKTNYEIPYVYFSTNGALLTKKRSVDILEAGIDSIKFSINAFSNEEYLKVHKKNDFEKVIHNLKYILELKKEDLFKVKIFISAVTDKKVDEVKNIFKDLYGDLFKYIDDIFIYELQFTPKFEEHRKITIDAKNCLISPFKEIYVNSDSTLGFCCKDFFDEISFGSLLENDFKKLYNCNEYKQLRNRFITNKFEKKSLCYQCLSFEGLKR